MTEFDEWLDPATVLTFTEDGPEYRVEPPSALVMLQIHQKIAEARALGEHDERQAIISILGPTWDKMAADGVADITAHHAGRAVLARYLDSAETALQVWTFSPPKDPPKPPEPQKVSIYGVDPDDSIDPPGTINQYDPGGGPYMPDKGIRVWAYPMEFAPVNQNQPDEKRDDERAAWADIFTSWEALEVDFASFFHLDLTPELLTEKSWRWFAVRLSRILGDPDTLTSRMISLRKAVDDGDTAR
ncbi:tail assembly chaperone [Gordonia phage Gudmit]|nr:tail assembly chaperone [Gordonia phage Gudmit]